MSNLPFNYNERDLEICARSESFRDDPSLYSKYDGECMRLFQQFITHFHRDMSIEDLKNKESKAIDRYQNFLTSVDFIYRHNQDATESHYVSLNRFSDKSNDEIIKEYGFKHVNRNLLEESWNSADADNVGFLNGVDFAMFTHLDSETTILHVASNLAIGKGSMNHLNPKVHNGKDVPSKTLRIPVDGENEPFETPQIGGLGLDGTILKIKEQKTKHKQALNDDNRVDDTTDEPAMDGDFLTFLNWATVANPDGVPLVHTAIDQVSSPTRFLMIRNIHLTGFLKGECGSCWALAATGTLEASAARHDAYMAYEVWKTEHSFPSKDEFQDANAIQDAQVAEKSAFQTLNLSIQELLDCDTAADQGCTGGNPLLAFYYIHRHGLASWDEYPYVGKEDICDKNAANHPIATVKSWGVISPNHEDHMELVLRYIGPIAVGVNGADTSFLAYSGGIFNKANCDQAANHALLITGYGQEIDRRGELVRYWIARNSWGTDWGENGFVRVKRGDGRKGTPGVCGIARSPSVALGGVLIGEDENSGHFLNYGSSDYSDNYPFQNICIWMGYERESWCSRVAKLIDSHKVLSLALLGLLFGMLAIWPLTRDCRRRMRRRRARKQKRLLQQGGLGKNSRGVDERTPLNETNTSQVSYGV